MELLRDLERELAGRCKDKRKDTGGVLRPDVEDGRGEGDGFARTGARAAETVFSWESVRRWRGMVDGWGVPAMISGMQAVWMGVGAVRRMPLSAETSHGSSPSVLKVVLGGDMRW